MNNQKSRADKDANMLAMKVLSEIRASNDAVELVTGAQPSIKDKLNSAAIDRAIDAIYMQNKILDQIDILKDKSCFMTDNEGVITLLKGLLVGNEENM